jgi:hypothetical protein
MKYCPYTLFGVLNRLEWSKNIKKHLTLQSLSYWIMVLDRIRLFYADPELVISDVNLTFQIKETLQLLFIHVIKSYKIQPRSYTSSLEN